MLAYSCYRIHRIQTRLSADSKKKEEKIMEQNENIMKKKGGRPKKAVKKDQLLPVKCDKDERKKIESRAKSVNLSVSQYMREISLNGQIDRREIVFPKEVLQLSGTLNHLAEPKSDRKKEERNC
jgi:hypothetical protein